MAAWKKLRNLVRGQTHTHELDDEMQFHLEMRRQQNIDQGMTAEEAERDARARFGNRTLLRERVRDASILTWLDTLLQDFKYTARSLRSSGMVAVLIVMVLALGIGANTAIFRVTHALMLRELPVRDASSLVHFRLGNFQSWGYIEAEETLTYLQWQELRQRQDVLDEVSAYADAELDLTLNAGVRQIDAVFATGEIFRLLGVEATRGRMLDDHDDTGGSTEPVAVISHAFWEREFAADAAVIGRTLFVEGQPFTIVGVAPARFYGLTVGRRSDVYLPLSQEPYVRGKDSALSNPLRYCLVVFGRLRPGLRLEQANQNLAALSRPAMDATLPAELPERARPDYLRQQFMMGSGATGVSYLRDTLDLPIAILGGIVFLLLLLAAFTTANLLLARATSRQRELAVRMAMGASRARIVRQLMLESLALAIGGIAAGMLLSRVLLNTMLSRTMFFGKPLQLDLSEDGVVFGFACLIGVASTLVFGIVPAFRVSQIAPVDAFKAAGATVAKPVILMRSILLAGQIAVTVLLIASAALFAGTLRNLVGGASGLRAEHAVVARIDLRRMPIPAIERSRFYAQLVERLERLPRAETAAVSCVTPLSGGGWQFFVNTGPEGGGKMHVHYNAVTPGFFRTFGTRLVSGRTFTALDAKAAPEIALVNETFVRKAFGGAAALGRTLTLDYPARRTVEIVGVVEDAKYRNLRADIPPTVYEPFWQLKEPPASVSLSLSTRGGEAILAAALDRTLAKEYPNLSYRVSTFRQQVNESVSQERIFAAICVLFGALALCLAAIGIYGVLSYTVEQRRPEFGIRMTLGASPGAVRRMVYRHCAITLGAGCLAGCILAIWAGRFVRSLLYGVTVDDPFVYAAVLTVIAGVALVAAVVPAIRASRSEVMTSLRGE
jgi:putative ABC transport system permease protein